MEATKSASDDGAADGALKDALEGRDGRALSPGGRWRRPRRGARGRNRSGRARSTAAGGRTRLATATGK